MKYSILGFNQQALIDYPHGKLKLEDVLLLRYIWDASPAPAMKHIIKNEKSYVWLNHDKVLEDLPILNISKDRLRKRLQQLVDLQLIEKINISNEGCRGTRVYYGLTHEAESLLYTGPVGKNTYCSDDQSAKTPTENTGPVGKNTYSNNKLNNNSKLNYNDIIETFENFGTPPTKKKSLYSRCREEVFRFIDIEDIRQLLLEYLDVRIKNEDKPLGINSWKGILKKLDKEFPKNEWREVIQQSINRNYASFFPVNKTSNNSPMWQREGIPHDGRYDNEDHRLSGEVF